MEKANFGQIVSFLFGIANDCLVDTYDVGDYRKIILPMMVIRRFDAVLEPTKEKVLKMKEQLDAAGITDQDEALCSVAGEAFCNSSPYTLSDLKSRTNQQQLKSDFILYLNGFSQNVQDIIKRFEFRNQIDKLSEHDILGLLISKFTDSSVNLSNRPIYDAKGNLVQPALDNHTMGTVFEEVIRKFNEETNITDIINEFYVKDSSKKVKAVMKQKGESGEYLTTNPPYGYMKDPDNPKRHWVVDDEAVAVVRQIFAWCMEGFGPSQIAKKLKEAKADCPTVHWMKMGRNAPAKTPDNPYNWAPRTITGILEKMEYLGHMVNFKTRKQSYRSKKKLENPPDQWKIFENTHEAIIDEETFARVQELRKNKRRPARTGKTNMFSGLVRCADCGEKLYYCTSNSFETRQDHFVCSTSRKKGKEVCDTHFIRAVVLEEGTLQHMRLVISCVAGYEDSFRRALGAKRSEEARKELSAKKRTLQKSENRLAELDRLFKRIYEDMVNGKLSEARFQMLSDDYEQEQADLRAKIEMLENEIQNQEDQAENVDRFIRQAKKYLYLEKLTPTVLNDMVNAVYVHAPDKSSGHRVQDVTISYNYIGILPANLLYDVVNGKAA